MIIIFITAVVISLILERQDRRHRLALQLGGHRAGIALLLLGVKGLRRSTTCSD